MENLTSGTGSYSGYSEQTIVNGTEAINGVTADGIVSVEYNFPWSWTNNNGGTDSGDSSGNFTFSTVTFLYLSGTDNQTGYVSPNVWFCMDSSTPKGNTFTLLDTEMTVESTNYSYTLPSQNVEAIFAEGKSNYQRNDAYGQFAAAYTWDAYFDPSTGYIIGYKYIETDTNSSSNDGFTWTDTLYVTSTSYPLTQAPASNPSGGNSFPTQYIVYAAAAVIIIVIIVMIAYAISRRNKLPKHPPQPRGYSPPQSGPPPEDINLTPKQPPVQQIVIKEVVKVKCRYCGALIDSTAEVCPYCGAPRT